jgi:hypothetical protein
VRRAGFARSALASAALLLVSHGALADEAPSNGDEKKDAGRGHEWAYVDADVGISYVNMASLSSSTLQQQNMASAGPSFGVGAGFRLFILSLGARATLNSLSSFNLWQMDAELGFHIPKGHWEPYLGLHGGYCFVGSLDDGISGSPTDSITGGDAGLQGGVDYYFNHYVSLGLALGGNALFLHGAPPPLPSGVALASLPAKDRMLYEQSGDSVGLGLGASLRLGFHL